MSEPVEQRVDLRELVDGRAAERKRARQSALAAAIIGAPESETTDEVLDADDELLDKLANKVADALIHKLDERA